MTHKFILTCLAFSFTVNSFCATPLPLTDNHVLTLNKVIELVLKNNLELKIRQLKPNILKEQQTIEESAFDAEHFANILYENKKTVQNARDFSAIEQSIISSNPKGNIYAEQNWRFNEGLKGKTTFGMDWQLSMRVNGQRNTVNSSGRFFSPEYETFVGFDFKQPILKNAGYKVNSARINMAWHEVNIASHEKEIQTINKVIEAVNSYYDLVFGQENHSVKAKAVDSTLRLLKENKERMQVGKMTPLDVAEAEVKVSKAKEEFYQSLDFLREKKIAILKLLSHKKTSHHDLNFKASYPNIPQPKNLDESDLYAIALANRPDIKLYMERIKKEQVAFSYSKNQKKPELDFLFTYGLGGLNDDVTRSVRNSVGHGTLQWTSGISFSMPLGNRKAEASYRIAQEKNHEAELNLRNLKINLNLGIANAISRIKTLRKRENNAIASVNFSTKALSLQQELLSNGRNTTRNVLDAQTDLFDAQTRALAAKIDVNKSYSELWSVCGVLLEKNRFKVWRNEVPKAYIHRKNFGDEKSNRGLRKQKAKSVFQFKKVSKTMTKKIEMEESLELKKRTSRRRPSRKLSVETIE